MRMRLMHLTLPKDMEIKENVFLDDRFGTTTPLALRVDKNFFFINNTRNNLYYDRIKLVFKILRENNADYSQRYSLTIKDNGEVTVENIDEEICKLKKYIKKAVIDDKMDLLDLQIKKTLLEKLVKLNRRYHIVNFKYNPER